MPSSARPNNHAAPPCPCRCGAGPSGRQPARMGMGLVECSRSPPVQHPKVPSGCSHAVAMSGGHQPSWEGIIAWLVVGPLSLPGLASALPRLFVPLLVLAVVVAVLRLIWWYTQV